MKIIASIITVIGLLITGICSLGIVFSMYSATNAMKSAETSGIGIFAQWFSYAQMLSYANLFGLAILFIGVVLMIVAMFTGRKKQVAG